LIRIGTSGFDYEDWRGAFYPETVPRKNWLRYYAQRFPTLELNFSYYRMPSSKQLASMLERSEGRIEFAIKAHRSMTHERTATDGDLGEFKEALKPLREAEKLGAVLAQFPYSFRQCEENRTYLKRLVDRLGQPLVVEMRRSDWAKDPIIDWLGRLGVGYCCVDEPRIKGLMPPLAVATTSPAYVRFHGRNAEKWYTHDRPEERYDYAYTPGELKEWVDKLKELDQKTGKVLVFFNNHFQGKAVDAAVALDRLLQGSYQG
jgi:uncharacterized protein YecE (DUF72 family)